MCSQQNIRSEEMSLDFDGCFEIGVSASVDIDNMKGLEITELKPATKENW